MPTALITGAGIRVGRAIACKLAEVGYDLILHANSSHAKASELVDEIVAGGSRAEVIIADLSQASGVDAIASAVDQLGMGLDVLVNNAGVYCSSPFEEVSREEYGRMQAVNVEAPFFLTQAVLPFLRASDSACVINITDSGLQTPYPGYAHYFVSKAGLEMLTRVLALELAPKIRVNGVGPGTVAYPESFDDALREKLRLAIPMKRIGDVDDIARAVLFLVRDAPFVTGQVICVDGGRSAR